MPTLVFTKALARHVDCPSARVEGRTVGAALDAFFQLNPRVRGYVLDDQGGLRHHMTIYVDGSMIRDQQNLSTPVSDDGEIYVMQALSGGVDG